MVEDCEPFCMPIAELLPQILPQEDQELRQQHHDRRDFRCLQCTDFLKEPVGCGSCSVRFCRCCMKNLPKTTVFRECPGCRNLFTVAKFDHLLAWRMCTSSLPCRYANCRASLPPAQITNHEATCTAASMYCRFQSFGCRWTGARGDIEQHEAMVCTLSKVEHGLEQFRLVVQNQQAKADGSAISEKGRLSVVREFLSLRDSFRVQQAKQALLPQATSKPVPSRPINDSLSTQLIKRFKDEPMTWRAQQSLLLQAIVSLQEVRTSGRQNTKWTKCKTTSSTIPLAPFDLNGKQQATISPK